MKANYLNRWLGWDWFGDHIHHNNCKECRFYSSCHEKNDKPDRCTKFKPKTFRKKGRRR